MKKLLDNFLEKNNDKLRSVYKIALIVVVYAIFHKFFEGLLSKFIVGEVLYSVKKSLALDIIFIAISSGFVLWTFIKIKKYTPSFNQILINLVFIGVYVYYRFIEQTWQFTPFEKFDSINYSDIIIVFSCCHILWWICSLKKCITQKDKPQSFFFDNPIKKAENEGADKTFSNYANQIAILINNNDVTDSKNEKSFAIGINGKWGKGKTSFMNLVVEGLDKDKTIVVNFNAWRSSSPNTLILDFFNTLVTELKPYNYFLSRTLVSYANKLADVSENKVIKAISSFISPPDSLETMHKKINDVITSIRKNIVIVIDDVDRLDKDEIVEVIRLIRNTADFKNTFYLVAYDKYYVEKALEQQNPFNHSLFLEKIFQMEVSLPIIENNNLISDLEQKLTSLGKYNSEEINEVFSPENFEYLEVLKSFITTYRDVNRLLNVLLLLDSKTAKEIYLHDFILIECLRMKYQNVYVHIFENTGKYLLQENNTLLLKRKKHAGPVEKGEEDIFVVQEIIENKTFNLQENDAVLATSLEYIFVYPTIIPGICNTNKNFSIRYPSCFNRYLSFQLKNSLSYLEFKETIFLNPKDSYLKIKSWVDDGLEDEVKRFFSIQNDFGNKDYFENTLKGISFLTSIKSKHDKTFYPNNYISYDAKTFFNQLLEYNRLGYFQEEITDFLSELFISEDIREVLYYGAALAKDYFTSNQNYELRNNYPFLGEFFKDMLLQFVNRYCNSKDTFDYELYFIVDCCYSWGNSTKILTEIFDEVKRIIKKHIEKNLFEFFNSSLIEDKFLGVIIFNNQDFIESIFNDWEEFNKFIQSINVQGQNIEFKTFMKEFIKADLYRGTEFKFSFPLKNIQGY